MKPPKWTKYHMRFLIMDGRARDAIVLDSFETLEEAMRDRYLYGTDTCIVDSKTMEFIQ